MLLAPALSLLLLALPRPHLAAPLCNVGEYDCRTIAAQTPVDTDTTRLADEVSSASATTCSPAFPAYLRAADDSADVNAAHAEEVRSKAAAQGIGDPSIGDARIEDSRLSVLPPNANNATAAQPTVSFSVDARSKFSVSSFSVQRGEQYSIKVSAGESWRDGAIRTDARGYEAFYDARSDCFVALGQCYPHLRSTPRLPTAPWFSLVCCIGSLLTVLGPVEPGHEASATYVAADEAALHASQFHVGLDLTFLAASTGELLCYANDAHSLYWNNRGAINVTVARLSWPAENGTYYSDLYAPSCDSALALYSGVGCVDKVRQDNQWDQ